ncbi:hypothetical protein PRIPAC_83954, partial [Pristionchus pacificus]
VVKGGGGWKGGPLVIIVLNFILLYLIPSSRTATILHVTVFRVQQSEYGMEISKYQESNLRLIKIRIDDIVIGVNRTLEDVVLMDETDSSIKLEEDEEQSSQIS